MPWTHSTRKPKVECYEWMALDAYERSDGRYQVGNSVGTYGERREWVVREKTPSGHWVPSHWFRRRFATAGAAQRAVDKRHPIKENNQ